MTGHEEAKREKNYYLFVATQIVIQIANAQRDTHTHTLSTRSLRADTWQVSQLKSSKSLFAMEFVE